MKNEYRFSVSEILFKIWLLWIAYSDMDNNIPYFGRGICCSMDFLAYFCDRIVTEFFPQSSQYEYAENVEFEVYSSADTSNPNYQCEIWIAVNEKTE